MAGPSAAGSPRVRTIQATGVMSSAAHYNLTPMYSRQDLADDFSRLGVAPADTVMLHASIRAVGDVAGGPDQIHLALKDALTPDGTLMMYASCPAHYDEVGRGNLTPDQERELADKLPA